MSLCEVTIKKPIMAVHLVTRYTSATYVFIGKYEYGTETIMKKVAKKQPISKKESDKLEDVYGKSFKHWLKQPNLSFIEDWINMDDSVSLLRKSVV